MFFYRTFVHHTVLLYTTQHCYEHLSKTNIKGQKRIKGQEASRSRYIINIVIDPIFIKNITPIFIGVQSLIYSSKILLE